MEGDILDMVFAHRYLINLYSRLYKLNLYIGGADTDVTTFTIILADNFPNFWRAERKYLKVLYRYRLHKEIGIFLDYLILVKEVICYFTMSMCI